MTPGEYRRKGLHAQQQGGSATDAVVKGAFAEIASHWFALAEQVEWLERTYGPIVAAASGSPPPPSADQASNQTAKE
jgi:hypothetical protein